ncbi:MAG: hypothetical protein CL844_06500 [Crocinitomicaceae bacterium]|nr:hypothetical protein [Crocinitomicaceae bacterium]
MVVLDRLVDEDARAELEAGVGLLVLLERLHRAVHVGNAHRRDREDEAVRALLVKLDVADHRRKHRLRQRRPHLVVLDRLLQLLKDDRQPLGLLLVGGRVAEENQRYHGHVILLLVRTDDATRGKVLGPLLLEAVGGVDEVGRELRLLADGEVAEVLANLLDVVLPLRLEDLCLARLLLVKGAELRGVEEARLGRRSGKERLLLALHGVGHHRTRHLRHRGPLGDNLATARVEEERLLADAVDVDHRLERPHLDDVAHLHAANVRLLVLREGLAVEADHHRAVDAAAAGIVRVRVREEALLALTWLVHAAASDGAVLRPAVVLLDHREEEGRKIRANVVVGAVAHDLRIHERHATLRNGARTVAFGYRLVFDLDDHALGARPRHAAAGALGALARDWLGGRLGKRRLHAKVVRLGVGVVLVRSGLGRLGRSRAFGAGHGGRSCRGLRERAVSDARKNASAIARLCCAFHPRMHSFWITKLWFF